MRRWERDTWLADKETAGKTVADLLLEPTKTQTLLPKLYAALGGTQDDTSPVTLKGGGAFMVYMSQQVCFHREKLPIGLRSIGQATDLDFSSTMKPVKMLDAVTTALSWLADSSVDVWPYWRSHNKPQWRLRFDRQYGEAFYKGRRYSLGRASDKSAEFPIKVTFTGGLSQTHDNRDFQLVRIGAALWDAKFRRAAVAAFVDISLEETALESVCVMGMRVQAPNSILKDMRRMAFHEVQYKPWRSAHEDEDKQQRRMERLLKLSFVEDWKIMGGASHGGASQGACEALQLRWDKAMYFMLMGDHSSLRHLAASAPRQMSFFLLCCARMFEAAGDVATREKCDSWVDVTAPLIADLLV